MAWQVMEYMDQNPQATPKEVVAHFAEELEVDRHLASLKNEVEDVLERRERLRPLYAKKYDMEHAMTAINSDLDMDVMLKYPPRKGTEAERKKWKITLQQNHEAYQMFLKETERLKEEITALEDETSDIQQRAKNARRILETFQIYAAYILGGQGAYIRNAPANQAPSNNQDTF